MKVAILTDTNSGIDEQEADSLGVHVIPMPLILDGKTYYEGTNFTEDQLCPLLLAGRKVTTSQPVLGDVVDEWEQLFRQGYDEIVYIPMSSGLSSSCSTARAVSEDYDGHVCVVDNHRISVTQRISVLKAKRMADRGMSAREIADYLENDAYNSSIYVSVDNLDCLKRGGRITPAAAAVAAVLSIKPVLTIQGEKLDSYAKVRGNMHRCEMKMLDGIRTDIEKRFNRPGVVRMHIGAAGFGISEENADQWLKMVKQAFPEADVFYDALPASIGTHTGPGAVGIGVSVDYDDYLCI